MSDPHATLEAIRPILERAANTSLPVQDNYNAIVDALDVVKAYFRELEAIHRKDRIIERISEEINATDEAATSRVFARNIYEAIKGELKQ
jgi:hypothetical protein